MELIARHLGREEKIHLDRSENGYHIVVGGVSYDVDVAPAGDGLLSLLIDGQQSEVTVRRRTGGHYSVTSAAGTSDVELMDPLTHLALLAHASSGTGGSQRITAYMPGRVVEILVREGEEVEAGQGILVLEAMKMKNEIQAESAGQVKKILVQEDQAVEGGDPLFEIE